MAVASPQSVKLPVVRMPLWRRPGFWVGVVGVTVLGLVGARVALRTSPEASKIERTELPVLSSVPAFSFVDQSGKPFESKNLGGQIWVANFIFTRCPNICPKFTAKMGALQDKSASSMPQLKLVSFTVDPEHDTPEVLAAYGEKHKADFTRWTFARGERADLEKVIKDGMLQPMDMGDGKDLNSVVHGSYFALIDGQLRVRGVYRFTEPGSVDDMLRDAQVLALSK
ncbi:MAG: SCO family protein [Archangium sp.]|nr:SCO family protein [Archangium sp.]